MRLISEAWLGWATGSMGGDGVENGCLGTGSMDDREGRMHSVGAVLEVLTDYRPECLNWERKTCATIETCLPSLSFMSSSASTTGFRCCNMFLRSAGISR